MNTVVASAKPPDGIDDSHIPDARSLWHRASWFSLAVLALLVGCALSGILGGQPSPVRVAETVDVRIAVKMPAVIRNGEFFETEIVITPKRDIAELVLEVDPRLWRDLTVNTFLPAPAEEAFKGGAFRFSYGPASAGDPLVLKLDSQINPSLFGGTRGAMTVSDGDATLATLPLSMRVLP